MIIVGLSMEITSQLAMLKSRISFGGFTMENISKQIFLRMRVAGLFPKQVIRKIITKQITLGENHTVSKTTMCL